MKTIRLTMAQALLKFLDQQYVEIDGQEHKFVHGVFGIFGHGNVTGIGEALEYGGTGLTFRQGRNEQGMVHAATAFAKQKNRLGIYACTSSIGPGAMNMVTGAATATVNRIPVLLLPGDIFASRQPDPVLQQIEVPWDYTLSANDCFKPVSRYWDRISRPEQLMTAGLNAMRVLTDPIETGAVTLSIPQDVQAEAYDYPAEFFEKRVHAIERAPLSKRALQEALEALKQTQKPLIVAGGGVHYSLATETLREFAEKFSIPVAETQGGKSALAWDHPMNVGGIGVTGSKAANLLAKEADLILAVGTRLGDFTTASKQAFANPDVQILSLNVAPLDGYKMGGIPLRADAKEGLQALSTEMEQARMETSAAYKETVLQLVQEWNAEVDRLYSWKLEQGNAQTQILGTVNRFVGNKDVVICAAGSLPGDLHRLWRSPAPKTYHLEYGFSCMGYEVAAGLGVKMAIDPDAEAYVVVGDGSYMMLHSELLTSIQEGYKITIILFDNHGFQCIKNLQMGNGSEGFGNEFRYRDPETNRLTGEYIPIDFAGYARSLGAKAYFAQNAEELDSALESAKKETVSTLIEVKVEPGTMTGGYESWWHVGVPATSNSPKVEAAHHAMQAQVAKAKRY